MKEIIKLNYDISFEDYLSYNKTVFDLQLGNKAKRTLWQGIIIMVLAVALVVVNCVFYNAEILYTVIGVLVFFMGLYSSLFYKVSAPKMLKKSVQQSFDLDKEGFSDREVTFYDEFFTDNPSEYGQISWDSVASVVQTNTQFLIMFPDMRGVIIPKDKVDCAAVETFLKDKMSEKQKEYFSLKEKGEDK